MRFDWYQATIPENPMVLVNLLQNTYGENVQVREGRGLHGYRQRFDIVGEDFVLASVLAGGENGHPNAWASGPETDAFQAIIREHWGGFMEHRVTRFDAAEDFDQEGAYEALRRVVRAVAKSEGVKGLEIVPEDAAEGRTFYAGAPTSAVRLRLYEKGKQERAKAKEPETIPANWTRIEVQVRPKQDSGFVAAMVSPEKAWGFSTWTQDVAKRALELDVPRVQIKPWRESDDDRAWRYMLRQYGPLLLRVKGDLGSWAAVGAQIGHDIHSKFRD
jgi:hypothetical protein